MSYVINPNTNRHIRVGGAAYRRLMRDQLKSKQHEQEYELEEEEEPYEDSEYAKPKPKKEPYRDLNYVQPRRTKKQPPLKIGKRKRVLQSNITDNGSAKMKTKKKAWCF